MELPSISLLSVTPIYLAVLGLLFIYLTLHVGLYRFSNKIDIGDGGDATLLRRMRCQANFVETVPIAAILLVSMELMGAGDNWLHVLGATLVVARISHFLGLSRTGPFICRPIGMVGTILVYLGASGWVLYGALG
jgi:uncharacterized membrane protein YecN with MAPEG domain